ncbi:MAG: hypothetical protein ACRCT1_17500 [Microcoleaceae cyanobacterium]
MLNHKTRRVDIYIISLAGSAAQVMFFVFSILIQKGLHRMASLVMQDYRLAEMPQKLSTLWNRFEGESMIGW